MNALTKRNDKAITLFGVGTYTEVGWTPPEQELEYGDWEQLYGAFAQIQASINWIIGDYLVYGEAHYGEEAAQAVSPLQWEPQRVANCKWVSKAIPMASRIIGLSWTHHSLVASLPERSRDYWLQRASSEKMSTEQLRKLLKTTQQTIENGTTPEPEAAIYSTDLPEVEEFSLDALPDVVQTHGTTKPSSARIVVTIEGDVITNGEIVDRGDGYVIIRVETGR
jgi:hypothetical protein